MKTYNEKKGLEGGSLDLERDPYTKADGGTIVLQYLPSELVGHYFEEVQAV